MPNPIKYTTGSESDALVKGNFRIGTGSVGKGPSDTTGYYQGPSVPSGGYVIYMNKDGAPGNLSYHSAANDAELISFTNSLAGQSYTTVNECFNYYYGQTDKVLVNQDYPADYPYIVMDGLVLNLDAGITQSYPGSGTAWTDINGLGPKNNGTLTNGPTFSTDGGGSIVFDGADDNIQIGDVINFIPNPSQVTCETWLKTNSIGSYKKIFVTGTPSIRILGIYFSIGPSPYQTYFGLKTSSTQDAVVTTTNLSTTNYSHVVGTYNDPTAKIYINGTLMATANIGGTIGTGGVGRISGYGDNAETWNGNISIFRIYNRALSASEVLQNYNAQKGRFGL
jgi:hypothetical protein